MCSRTYPHTVFLFKNKIVVAADNDSCGVHQVSVLAPVSCVFNCD